MDNVAFDGPKLYIVLSEFHNPDLPAELLSVGVPLTCIFEIKLSDEQYVAQRETEVQNTTIRDKTHFFKDHRVNENELLEFWRVTRERFANLPAHPIYSNVIILTIRLSVFPERTNFAEKESLKRDVYDRVLLTLHHLYDLYQRHAKYLKDMKLEKGIDKGDEALDTRIYEDALRDIPNEYIDVPLLLGAILLQVEHNLATSSDGHLPVDHVAGIGGADTRHENTSTTAERIPLFNMQDKLRLLDLEYELTDEYADGSQSSQPSDLEVIPYGDTLSLIIRHYLDHRPVRSLEDAVLGVLRDPRIISVWRNHQAPASSKSDMYFCHMDNIAHEFNREQMVSREEVAHYLHLLAFDRLIFSESSREAAAQSTRLSRDELSELRHARSTIRRARSAPNLMSSPSFTGASRLSRSKSDTEIEYCKPIVAYTKCPLLFALTDARETLLPGYLRKNVFDKRSYERPSLEEYEDVELLSSRVFLQVVHECFQSFDRFAARYFEPTDSMLLYFSNNNAMGQVSEERRLSSIRTPIGLCEFCEYIAEEKEENRMKREQETRQSRGTGLTGRFMKKSIEVEDGAIIFDDECFVLPDSLKARRLKKSPDRDGQKKIFETKEEFADAAKRNAAVEGKKMTRQKRNGAPMANNGSKRADGRVMSGKTSMTEKKSDTKIDDVDTSFLPVKKILSSQCVETGGPRDLVGYDLGDLRVQVIHHSKKFLLDDDTSVSVELEDWLHGGRDLRIAVTLSRCTLRLSGGVSRRQPADTFHLTTKRGIVLGFQRNRGELGN